MTESLTPVATLPTPTPAGAIGPTARELIEYVGSEFAVTANDVAVMFDLGETPEGRKSAETVLLRAACVTSEGSWSLATEFDGDPDGAVEAWMDKNGPDRVDVALLANVNQTDVPGTAPTEADPAPTEAEAAPVDADAKGAKKKRGSSKKKAPPKATKAAKTKTKAKTKAKDKDEPVAAAPTPAPEPTPAAEVDPLVAQAKALADALAKDKKLAPIADLLVAMADRLVSSRTKRSKSNGDGRKRGKSDDIFGWAAAKLAAGAEKETVAAAIECSVSYLRKRLNRLPEGFTPDPAVAAEYDAKLAA